MNQNIISMMKISFLDYFMHNLKGTLFSAEEGGKIFRENHRKQKNFVRMLFHVFQVKMVFRLKEFQPCLIPNFQKKLFIIRGTEKANLRGAYHFVRTGPLARVVRSQM